jgi:hypothetical protein
VSKNTCGSSVFDPPQSQLSFRIRIRSYGSGYDHTDPDPHQNKILHFFVFLSTISLWFFFGVADPIPDLDFYPSRILDPTTASKERDEKKLVVIPFLKPHI